MRRSSQRHGWARRIWVLAIGAILLGAVDARAGWEEGRAAFNAGEYRQAILEFQTVLDQHPSYGPGHYMIGLSLYRLGEVDRALPSFTTAVELEADNPHYLVALGRALVDSARYQEAFDALRLLEYGSLPENLQRAFVQLLAAAATRVGQAGVATAAIEAAVADSPEDVDLWVGLGQARTAADDDVGAFEAFVKVTELDPELASASRRAAEAAMRIGDDLSEPADRGSWYRWGAEYADKAAGLEPTAENQLLAGVAWSGAAEHGLAEQWFQRAVQTEPDNAVALYQLGRSLSAQDRDGEALGPLGRALGVVEQDALRRNVLRAIAFAHRKQEQFREAESVYAELGDTARVAEMQRLAEIVQQNLEADAGVRECFSRWEALQGLMERNRHLEGSPAWDAIAAQERQIRTECGEALGL